MKNLKLYSEIPQSLELHSDKEVLLFAANDIERNRLFFASSANFIYSVHLSSFKNGRGWTKTMLSAEVDCIDLEPGDFITSFDYLMEKESLVLGTSSGLLLLYNVDSNSSEVVGKVEGGVKCISPSPDGDLLGITTGFGQLLVMTHDWDLLYETTLEEIPEGVDVCEPEICSGNSQVSPISWRGDGKYFATLSEVCDSGSGHKKIKIWERDSGALHSSSEPKDFMGAVLDWMPSGAKIAAVYDRKLQSASPSIVFFERNGLERSSFSIVEPIDATVENLKWNCASDLLAGVVRCKTHDSIRIWFFSNNHWYLKHEIRYSKEDGVRFMWDPTMPLQLACWTHGGQLMLYNFIWTSAVMEDSTAFVIDNSRILVTPLTVSLMPPPMSLFILKFPSPVKDMAYFARNSKNCLAVCVSDGALCVVELPAPHTWEDLEGKEFSVESSSCETALGSFVHLTWLDVHTLLAVSHYGFSQSSYSPPLCENGLHGYYMQEIEVLCSEDNVPGLVSCTGWHARASFQKSLDTPVTALASDPAKIFSAFVQLDGGRVLGYMSKSGIVESPLRHDDISFSSSCPWMSVVRVDVSGNLKPLVCGLDDIGRLHINGRVLCSNCSSFVFYSKWADTLMTHMMLTTKQDLLCIFDISDLLQGEMEAKQENFTLGSRRREDENMNYINIWERGAKVIGVLHGDEAAAILQTTRGNLECIYPRKLVLSSIVNALIQQRFRDALHMVRRHRIDFNVIVDHCGWKAFLQSAPEFVKQVNNLNYITEFVCAIKNENITETLYRNFIPFQKDQMGLQTEDFTGPDSKNKVTTVLLAISKALEEQMPESPARELCILTTLARSDPPFLGEALERIKSIREMELSGSDDPRRQSCPSSEEALKHLLWLSDSEAVFEAALGLYDLNLAAIVALSDQRDPKEFLPYLQELERMSGPLMRYNIDLRLHRFESALKNIVSAGEDYFADCMSVITKNPQLFPLGLQLIADPAKRTQVLEALGDHLSNRKCFEDAATTYMCCSRLDKALKAYRNCGNWSGVLTVAGLMKLGEDAILEVAHELCEELNALGKPGEAAKIALEYCKDVSGGINLLINAREWEESLRVAFCHKGEDLISEVKNASLECVSNLVGEYKEGLEKVGKYLTRYLAVRQRRLLLAAKLRSEERSMSDLDDDAASEASSNFSGMSAYTLGTRRGTTASISSTVASKARDTRRQKKRGKIRPGSPDEELALVEHLKGMSLTDGAKRELKSLLICLVMLGEEESAWKLQHAAENFQLSQMAAVKLAEDTMTNDNINEDAHTLERYMHKVKSEVLNSDSFGWQLKVFASV